MAKKNLAGQLNMFDVFRELENNMETAGEVEMVSLMPETEPAVKHDDSVKSQKKSASDHKQEDGYIYENNIVEDNIVEDNIVEDNIVEDNIVEDNIVEDNIVENDISELTIAGMDIDENKIVENKIAESEIAENIIQEIDLKVHEIHKDATEKISDVAMHREKHDADGNVIAEISYINYNKVLIRRKGHDDILKCFDNSHDAVDYYVENMNLNN